MATYVNDLRLKEIATGDESGTWGTSTNTNLELIADAFSYATKDCFATDADATETMADGVADEIRSLYLKVTSSATLTATRTLTLAPNTVSKTWIIENATTGGQSISISQGSGANVTIPNGDTKVIYTDGAGAGAAVVDAFASLNVGDLTATNITGTLATAAQPNITSVGTLTGFTSTGIDDNATSTAITIDSSENVGIGTASPTANLVVTQSGNTPTNGFSSTQFQGCFVNTGTTTSIARVGIYSGNATTALLNFGDVDDADIGGISYDNSDNSMALRTNNSERLRIDSSGNVGIGTTNPVAKFAVGGAGRRIEIDTGGVIRGFDRTASWEAIDFEAASYTFDISGTESMRIDTSGNVGIGTASPASALHVKSTGSLPAKFEGGTNSYTQWLNSTGTAGYVGSSAGIGSGGVTDLGVRSENNLIFLTNAGSERMRILTAGQVVMGRSNDFGSLGYKLQVDFSGTTTGILATSDDTASKTALYMSDKNVGGAAGTITFDGASAQYNTSSDYRLKENIQPLANGLARVQQLNPVQFDWIATGGTSEGFIAHEAQEVFAEAVSGEKDGTEMQGMDYGRITPLLVKAIQEQQTIIESLEARITALES